MLDTALPETELLPLEVEARDQARRLLQMAHNLRMPGLTTEAITAAANAAEAVADELLVRIGFEVSR